MIPKVIHYIWLGGKEEPKILQKCKATWKKYCPDYEIKRWDESNLNIYEIPYTQEAIDAKKYAFASDYFRFKILAEEGGIYLDIDVKLLKPLDDFLNEKCFMGFEKGVKPKINPGLVCGAEPGSEIMKALQNSYNYEHFVDKQGKMNLKTICDRSTEVLKKYGLEAVDKTQKFDNFTVFASEYFCPMSFLKNDKKITKNTYSIHLYASTWMKAPFLQRLKYRFLKFIGEKNANKLKKIFKKDKNTQNDKQTD